MKTTKERKNNSSCKIVQFANQHNCSESKAELLRLSAQQCRQAVVMKQIFLSFFSLLLPPDSDALIGSRCFFFSASRESFTS